LPKHPPAALAEAAATAGNWLSGPRPADLAGQLAAWHAWMEESLTAWQQDRPLPEWIPASAPLASQAEATPVTTPVPPAPVPAQSRWQPPADPVAFESVAVLPPGADPEMMRLFCFEAEELLADIEQATMALEAAPDDAETLATLFRGFHTLKGNAAVMRLVVLQRLTHEVESLLDAARRGSRRLDRDAIDVVLAAADLVNRAVTEMSHQLDGRDAGRSLPLPVTAVIERVHVVLKSPPAADTPSEPGHTAAAPTSQPLADEPADAQPAPAAGSSAPAAAAATVPRAPAAAVKSKAPPPTATRPAAAAKPAASSGSVRVDTCKLDGLVDLVGELVIAQSMVVQAAESNGDEHLSRTLGQLRSITADLQRTAMAMRMVPIRGTFQCPSGEPSRRWAGWFAMWPATWARRSVWSWRGRRPSSTAP